ncbi:LuxR C-terminal-related transcriptional regulator [Actinocrinis sp.]|uniref:LuxR C-terminal-related transcriptional regulator n=1 Tax=Actinocrinis sp. TaxID=1920516 RepID=UPI002D4020D4|nr:LuxR C-terminal-related transcriptional regulator [Actinocrinis sp.]HZP54975.1 LuxR C-terminal-related transcriptional regulator [Actinocrinis sp.]
MTGPAAWLGAYPKRPGAPLILPGATLAEALGRQPHRKPAALDPRLAALLPLLAANLTQAQIGARLALSPSAVKHRARRLYTALGVSNRVGAVTAALACGLIEEPGSEP